MHHEATKSTKLHEEQYSNGHGCRSPEARARAEAISSQIIAAAIEVHHLLGPGLLESVYEACLARELSLRGVKYQQQVPLAITYRGVQLEASHRLDLLVEGLVVVELKSVENLERIHEVQLLTYLRLSGRWLGLLVNFNTDLLKHGLRRMLNG